MAFRRSVTPHEQPSFYLLWPCCAGVRGLWAAHDAAAAAGRDLHPYLVISTASTTRVLEDSRALTGDGDDLNEVSDTCGSIACYSLQAP